MNWKRVFGLFLTFGWLFAAGVLFYIWFVREGGFIWLLHQSWFAISPGPWSLMFYTVMASIGCWKLLKAGIEYRTQKYAWVVAWLDALFILLIVILFQDTIWLCINTWRWILPYYMHVATFWNYWVRFPQNIIGALFLFLVSYGVWEAKFVSFKNRTVTWFIVIFWLTFFLFAVAPSQAWTDWTFASRNGFSDSTILYSFLISNVGYKILIAGAYLSLFNRTSLHKPFKENAQEKDVIP